MTRFKTLTVAVLAAATVAIGGLAAAPSASAMPNQRTCDVMVAKGNIAFALGNVYTGRCASLPTTGSTAPRRSSRARRRATGSRRRAFPPAPPPSRRRKRRPR